MKNKKSSIRLYVGIIIFFIIFIAIPVVFNVFSIDVLPMTFIGAAMGAVITIMITNFLLERQSATQEKLLEKQSEAQDKLLEKQSKTDEQKKYHLKIFEKKSVYFQEFIDLVWYIWTEEKITCEQYEKLTSAYYKNLMIYIKDENRLHDIGEAITKLGDCLENESNDIVKIIHENVINIINKLSEDLETGGQIIPTQIAEHKNKLFPVKFRKELLKSFNDSLVSDNSDIFENGQWQKWEEGKNINHDDMVFNFKNYKGCSIRFGFVYEKGVYHKNFYVFLIIPFGKSYHSFNRFRCGLDNSLLNRRIELNHNNVFLGKNNDDIEIPSFNFSSEKLNEISNKYDYHQISKDLAQRATALFSDLRTVKDNLLIIELLEKYYEK